MILNSVIFTSEMDILNPENAFSTFFGAEAAPLPSCRGCEWTLLEAKKKKKKCCKKYKKSKRCKSCPKQ